MIKNSLKEIKLVDRTSLILKLCQNARVLHLGATDDPYTREAAEADSLLHLKIDKIANYLIGLDIAKKQIEWLSMYHNINNIQVGNIEEINDYPQEDFDIIIAGEIIEHLNNPGKALEAIYQIVKTNTQLVITVPNAYSLKGFLRSFLKYELIHPDHVLHHSPHTMKVLLERHGFTIQTYFSYYNGGEGFLATVANSFLKFHPQLAEGIGFICVPNK